MWLRPSRCAFVLTLTSAAWISPAIAQDQVPVEALDLDTTVSLDRLAAQLTTKRVIFIGETHNRYDNHLNQLELIRRLHQLDPNLAIGVEYFQQPYQAHVDDYIAGRTTENEFLRATDYFQNWGYDYRLYAPIFRFAREQRIPVRALNVPGSLPAAVAKVGIAGLSEPQRAYLPKEIVPADAEYKSRLHNAFEEHGDAKPDAFEHFVEAQLVWDEGMAESAAAYLNENPGRRMVILAGFGHLAFGAGIPKRLARRTNASYAIVSNDGQDVELHIADYLLLSNPQELPPPGTLGVNLEDKGGSCRIKSIVPGGPAEKAGLKPGDVLVDIDGQMVNRPADVRFALWERKPGDRVRLSVRQKARFGKIATRNFDIELAPPGKTTEPRS